LLYNNLNFSQVMNTRINCFLIFPVWSQIHSCYLKSGKFPCSFELKFQFLLSSLATSARDILKANFWWQKNLKRCKRNLQLKASRQFHQLYTHTFFVRTLFQQLFPRTHNVHVTRKKAAITTFVQKIQSKMLMKLTPASKRIHWTEMVPKQG